MNILASVETHTNKVGDSHLVLFQAWRCQPGSPEAQWDQGPWQNRYRQSQLRDVSPAHSHRLASLEALELRVPEIERLVVPGVAVRGAERFGMGPRFECAVALPLRVRGIKRVILGLWAFEQVELDEARHLVEMTVARQPDVLEGSFGTFGDTEPVHGNKYRVVSWFVLVWSNIWRAEDRALQIWRAEDRALQRRCGIPSLARLRPHPVQAVKGQPSDGSCKTAGSFARVIVSFLL